MILAFAAISLIALFDFVPIIKNKEKKELFALLVMFVPSLILIILIMFGVSIPSIPVLLWKWLKSIGIAYNTR